jgi:hypothetical protein
MKKIITIGLMSIAVLLICSFSELKKVQNDEIRIPEGYRNWTHIKTAISNPAFAAHSGFHHIYANAKALEGYKTGQFQDSAIIVFDVLESLPQKDGDIYEGKRKLIDVMVKNSSKYSETGGWGYEEFIYSDNTEIKAIHPTKNQCFNCHNTQKDKGYIFSKYRS